MRERIGPASGGIGFIRQQGGRRDRFWLHAEIRRQGMPEELLMAAQILEPTARDIEPRLRCDRPIISSRLRADLRSIPTGGETIHVFTSRSLYSRRFD